MLELRNISLYKDNKQILLDVNLKLDENKFYVITGPNGSGKSTLAKIIMGIMKPDTGSIIFNGEDITNLTIDERAKKGIAFAFQQPVKFKGLTVWDLLKLSAKNTIDKQTACEVLGKVGLCAKEYINREINGSLSGGELKRIEIASVVLRNAQLTIFDEPEAGIDLWSFNNLIELFEETKKQINGSILIISHQERILNIANEIILLENGKILDNSERKDSLVGNIKERKCCMFEGGACNG